MDNQQTINTRSSLACVLLLLAAIAIYASQTSHPSRTYRLIGKVSTEIVPSVVTSRPLSATSGPSCPTIEDVDASIVACRKLIDDANYIVRQSTNMGSPQTLQQNIGAWRSKQKDWEAHNQVLLQSCELLLGADGTPVYPEIPLSLENLNLAGKWLGRSMDSAAQSKMRTSKVYLRGSRAAVDWAQRVCDGRFKSDRHAGVIKIPGYIKAGLRGIVWVNLPDLPSRLVA